MTAAHRNGEATGQAGTGRVLMDDPMNVVLWIAGDRFVLRYQGLGAGPLEVSVEFFP